LKEATSVDNIRARYTIILYVCVLEHNTQGAYICFDKIHIDRIYTCAHQNTMPIHNIEPFEVEEQQGSNNVITSNGQTINNTLGDEQVCIYHYPG
jgi:hypothetical protein